MATPPPGNALQFLPLKFPAEGELHTGKENVAGKGLNTESTSSRLIFPNEFPYEFDSPCFSSAFSSPGDSTETEESSDDEEDFLAGLTRRLALSTQRLSGPSFPNEKTEERSGVVASSPQSTLSGFCSWSASGSGSPSGSTSLVPSPPSTPFCDKDETWDVINAAAGQVARLKMSSEPTLSYPNPSGRALLHLPRNPDTVTQLAKSHYGPFCCNQGLSQNYVHSNQYMRKEEALKQQCISIWGRQGRDPYLQVEPKVQNAEFQVQNRGCGIVGCENGRYVRALGPRQSAWRPPSPQQPRSSHSLEATMSSVFSTGSGVKPQSAGTGVFLPRRYTNTSDSRKKLGCSNVHLQRKVVESLNLNFDDMASFIQPPQRFSAGFNCYDPMMARRNALLLQQRRSLAPIGGALKQDMPLPQDWMY